MWNWYSIAFFAATLISRELTASLIYLALSDRLQAEINRDELRSVIRIFHPEKIGGENPLRPEKKNVDNPVFTPDW